MRFFADIKKIVVEDDLNKVNEYLSNGAVLIDTLIIRNIDEDGFSDFAQYIIGLPNDQ